MNNEEREGAHLVGLTLSSLPINLHRCTVHLIVSAPFAFHGTTCILFPILRLLTGSELMWNNALVIWDVAAAAPLLLLQGGNFFLRLSRRLFPCGGRATPVVPPFIRARERLHERECLHSVQQF